MLVEGVNSSRRTSHGQGINTNINYAEAIGGIKKVERGAANTSDVPLIN